MITDEQIVKEWDIFKRCDNCANKGIREKYEKEHAEAV